MHNIQMEIPILEQGASKLWTAEHRAWNSVRNFPLESTTPSTRNWPTRLLFYFCAKPVFFFIPKILLFLTRVHFNWWLIDPLLTASWLNMVLETAFICWLRKCQYRVRPVYSSIFVPSQVFFLHSKNSALSNTRWLKLVLFLTASWGTVNWGISSETEMTRPLFCAMHFLDKS